jgi:hypothetical protein
MKTNKLKACDDIATNIEELMIINRLTLLGPIFTKFQVVSIPKPTFQLGFQMSVSLPAQATIQIMFWRYCIGMAIGMLQGDDKS